MASMPRRTDIFRDRLDLPHTADGTLGPSKGERRCVRWRRRSARRQRNRRSRSRRAFPLKEEEHIFILKGSATLILGPRKYVMKERDYCCFPAGQRADSLTAISALYAGRSASIGYEPRTSIDTVNSVASVAKVATYTGVWSTRL
jgi:hypothetical protein